MKKVAVIVCNNGLGHIKRVLWLLRLFYRKFPSKIQADVFVNSDKLKYFPSISNYFNKNKYGINFFNINTENFNYEKEFLNKYKNHLLCVDYIWCDNLIFPLKYRKEVFLTGSFLWLDAIDDTNIAKREKEILLENHSVMIANKYFATPNVKSLTQFIGVGMYEYFTFHIPEDFPHKILLSCGKSTSANIFLKKYIPVLKKEIKKIPSNIEVFIEPDYYQHFCVAENIKKANFSEEMFSCISAAAIRPGIGTICDILLKGGRIFSFFEDNHFEINHNAEVLEKLGVGKKCQNVTEALAQAVEYLFDKRQQEKHINSLKKLDFQGLDETVIKIKEILN